MFYRHTWAEVNLDAFEHNINCIKETVGNKAVFGVIKANAYGHGDEMIARECIRLGCPLLCVSSLDEALGLRLKGIDHDIFIMGFTDPNQSRLLLENNIITTVPSVEWMKSIVKYPVQGLRLHIKLNTGMNRLGVRTQEEIQEILALGLEHGCLFEGIFTHFMSSGWHKEKTMDQYNRYRKLVEDSNFNFKWIHCANSDAIFSLEDDFSNACRPGVAMYGLSDIESTRDKLQEVISLYARVTQTKYVSKDEKVGYDEAYTSLNDEYIATVPLGYADGFPRVHSGHYSFIGVKPCMIIGKICMDQLIIRCDSDTKMGDIVEFIGPHRSILDIERETPLTACETMTGLSDRIPRVYIRNNEVIGDINPRMNKGVY